LQQRTQEQRSPTNDIPSVVSVLTFERGWRVARRGGEKSLRRTSSLEN
jgi:hypothetical protein